jgi:hypothetical protein
MHDTQQLNSVLYYPIEDQIAADGKAAHPGAQVASVRANARHGRDQFNLLVKPPKQLSALAGLLLPLERSACRVNYTLGGDLDKLASIRLSDGLVEQNSQLLHILLESVLPEGAFDPAPPRSLPARTHTAQTPLSHR